MDIMRRALQKCRRHFIGTAWISALINLLYIAPTLYMLQVYDRVVPTQGLQTLVFLTFVMLFALATLALLDRVRGRLLVRASVQLDLDMAPIILDATLGRPGLPIARQALREFDIMRGTLTSPGMLALFDAPWMPIYLLVCFLVHPWIGTVAVLGCAALPAIAWTTERATAARLAQAQALAVTAYTNQDAILASAEIVRALGMRGNLVKRQLRQRTAMLIQQTEANFAGSGFLTATKFTRLALQSLALGLGALLAIDNKISGGAIFASSFLIARALGPVEQLIASWKPLMLARQSYKNLATLTNEAPLTINQTRLPPPEGGLSVENLTIFDEVGRGSVVNAASFTVAVGEVIAIVGPSGAGKSTLIRAIAGAIVPDRGFIRFDGADAKDWDPERLGRYIGYLPQDAGLFAGSIAENIARFSAETDADRGVIDAGVIAAAQVVGADTLIKRLPGGYDHQLKLGGRGVSAGQAQRIALARAVFGNPMILILDEPNAHLDVEGDAALSSAIKALKDQGRTILIVSHKPNILPVVDKMLVMRDGRITHYGSRDEVLTQVRTASVSRVRPRREPLVQ